MTYLISDEVQESELNKVTGKVAGYINGLDGKITKEDLWGRRKLAYPIKKLDFATYVTIYFNLPASAVKEFSQEMRLTTQIVRHLLTVVDEGETDMSLSAEEIADTAAIEEAVGGQRSFEAVLGETEESKDLMSVREAEKQGDEEEAKEEVAKEIPAEIVEEEVAPTITPKTDVEVSPEKVEEPKVEAIKEKKVAAKKVKKDPADEAERLSKLNEELDDILKDEL